MLREGNQEWQYPRLPYPTKQVKFTITPCPFYFSISSEILIDFELTLFTVLIFFTDNRWSEVRRQSEKPCNLIAGNGKHQQSVKP